MQLQAWRGLALGSRLKALSDALYDASDAVYGARGLKFESRWFPVVRLLHDRGPTAVTDVAREIGQSHSAVSQLAERLLKTGWIARRKDPADSRRSLLALTPRAQIEVRRLKAVWRGVADEVHADLAAAGHDLLRALDAFEQRLARAPIAPRILDRLTRYDAEALRVVPFRPELRQHFYDLNADWLRKYFYLEAIDHRVLSRPEEEIIAPGGAVLFALLGDEVVGTCALKLEAPGVYELTKMAVIEERRGLGIGRALLEAAIAEFRRRRGRTLFLESSTKLGPALRLYEALGFEHQPGPKPGSHYQRSDVYMIWRDPEAKTTPPRASIARAAKAKSESSKKSPPRPRVAAKNRAKTVRRRPGA